VTRLISLQRAFPGELLQPQGDVAAVEAGDRDQWPPGVKEPGAGAFFEPEGAIADCPAGFYILRAAFFAGCRLVRVAPPNSLQTANLDRWIKGAAMVPHRGLVGSAIRRCVMWVCLSPLGLWNTAMVAPRSQACAALRPGL
jgi:hypothetical protein